MSGTADKARAMLLQFANAHFEKYGRFPPRLRVGPDICRACLQDGAIEARILLYPRNPESWVTIVADLELLGPSVVVDPPPKEQTAGQNNH